VNLKIGRENTKNFRISEEEKMMNGIKNIKNFALT